MTGLSEITIVNRSKLPKPLVIVQQNTDLPGYHNMLVFGLSARSSRYWHPRVFCQRRGRYSIGRLTATVTDPFGLFSLQRNLGENKSLLVYPATLELPLFSPLSRNELRSSPNRWLGSEVGPDAARVREYATGDSLNHIHWQSTAHTGKLMVKVFEHEHFPNTAGTVWIVTDMHQASHVGNNSQSTEEYCVTIAASLIRKYIENGTRVGLITAGDRRYLFPPEAGEQHLWRMLEALAVIRATGKVPIERLISGEMKHLGAKSVIIVVTPSPSLQIVASLRRVMSREITTVAIILDTISFGGAVSVAHVARRLVSIGAQVYIVKHGEALATALDSHAFSMSLRYFGDRV